MMRCQDCGNKSKKDCVYMRCRTCCKTRGFRCQTHIKSTWVPASKRTHSNIIASSNTIIQQQQHHEKQFFVGPSPKRSRDQHQDPSSSSSGNLNFPAEVHIPATFRCVRVSSNDNALDDQYAYQSAVSIGGHIFKGILYDQGLEGSSNTMVEHRNIIIPTNAATPSIGYQIPFTSFIPGMQQYFPYPKS